MSSFVERVADQVQHRDELAEDEHAVAAGDGLLR